MRTNGIGFRTKTSLSGAYNGVSGFNTVSKSFDTPTFPPNSLQKLTLSVWVKRSSTGTISEIYEQDTGLTGVGARLGFDATDHLRIIIDNVSATWTTTNTFASTTTWYHIVMAIDTTQATAANRQQIYVNGVLQAGAGTTYNLNDNVLGSACRMCRFQLNTLNGIFAYGTFVSAQQLPPPNFSQSNGTNTFPIRFSGVFGSSGWLLNFSNTAAIGADTSGNSNNWNANGLVAGDVSAQTIFY